MSSILGASSNAAAAGITGGYGLYNQLSRYVHGDESRVHFIVNNIAQVQFDACLSETHVYQSAPTVFPLEDGGQISDHISVAPIELQLVGAVSDNPVQSTDALVNAAAGTALNYATSKLGALGTLGSTAGFTALKAYGSRPADDPKHPQISRSAQMYNTLRRLAGYTQVQDFSGEPYLKVPETFDVVTAKQGKKFCQFRNMAITSLQLQRDNSTGSRSLVFALSLQEIRVAYSKSILVTAQPDKSSVKGKAGEAAKEIDKNEERFQKEYGNTYKNQAEYLTPNAK